MYSFRSIALAARFTLPEPQDEGRGQCSQPHPTVDSPWLGTSQEGSFLGGHGEGKGVL